MSRRVIAIDIDEVLFPFVPEILKYYHDKYAVQHAIEDYISYDFDLVWNIPLKESLKRISDFTRLFHTDVEPIEGAKEAISELSPDFHLIIVTARDKEFEVQTRAWLDRHFPRLFSGLVFAGNHFTGNGYTRKVDICRLISAELLIDDSPRYVQECLEGGMDAILFGDYPWNRNAALSGSVVRAKGWSEVVEFLRQYR